MTDTFQDIKDDGACYAGQPQREAVEHDEKFTDLD